VRLDIPCHKLVHQGRCRQEILELFNWRYEDLRSLPQVLPDANSESPYNFGNAGFRYNYQFINVPDFEGKGEQAPMPFFYQNLAEAEFVIATYMYMVLSGYPAQKITILTTYNGQKFLLRDIFQQKCAWNPMFQRPKITTVDKYQGQQNDYILLSLVRTSTIGHIRDPRRLVVAMSRARLGLYVFGKFKLYQGCYETRKTFNKFKDVPITLQIIEGESYPTQRKHDHELDKDKCTEVMDFKNMYGIVQKMLSNLLPKEA